MKSLSEVKRSIYIKLQTGFIIKKYGKSYSPVTTDRSAIKVNIKEQRTEEGPAL